MTTPLRAKGASGPAATGAEAPAPESRVIVTCPSCGEDLGTTSLPVAEPQRVAADTPCAACVRKMLAGELPYDLDHENWAGIKGHLVEVNGGVHVWWCWRPGHESSAAIRSGVAGDLLEAEGALEEAMDDLAEAARG